MTSVLIPGVDDARRLSSSCPTMRTMLVRSRLLDRLRARWTVPVVAVTAPAGYGKTTLLTQVTEANASAPVGLDCWVTCARGLTSVSQLGAELCRALDATPPPPGHGDPAELARAVVDAMWRRSPQQVTLLVDDVHEVPPDSETATLLDLVIASLPTNGHVVLVGRGQLPVRLARLDVEGKVVRIDRSEMAFTPAELTELAALRRAPAERVAASQGWPALAELYASDRSEVVGLYVGEEVLPTVPDSTRRAIGLLAHLAHFDLGLAHAVLGDDVDVVALLADLPLVTRLADDRWHLHTLWQSLLAADVTPAEVREARRRAGVELGRRGPVAEAIPLLVDAEAWDEFDDAITAALGIARPPVARDMLADWFSRLPATARNRPGGRLLAGVLAIEADTDAAWATLQEAEQAFRHQGYVAGELACLVQRGQLAWWTEDPDSLAAVAARGFEMEEDGCEEVIPLACLARALLHDIANDSQAMIAELDKIAPGALNDAWWGIVTWTRAIGLLELGHMPEALAATEEALTHSELLHAPLAQTTRLQALWYQGRLAEVQAALPKALRDIGGSGYRHHTALVAGQCAVVRGMVGELEAGHDCLEQARVAAVGMSHAPLVDTILSVAEATLASVAGDDPHAAAVLSAYTTRHPVRQGLTAGPQQRHLALFYVLVPETRPIWDTADLGPVWAFSRDLARAVVAAREDGRLPASTPVLTDVDAVRAHLPSPWLAELGVAAVASGRADGWLLLDATWQASRPTVVGLAEQAAQPIRQAACDILGRLPAPPTRQLELRLLGPVELFDGQALTQASDWRRQRVRSLLAHLALHGTTSRAKLAEDLWPGLDPEAQLRNLRVTLTYLLRVLEPERGARDASFFVRQSGSNVTLHPGAWLSVDIWDFDSHAELATKADHHGSPAVALDHAMRAVELWRNEPIELASESWGVALLEERRLRFAALATRAGELLLARDETEQARALAQRALEVDPWSERAHRLVVATHLAHDDELGARRALRRYGDATVELGVTPGETTRMVERLLDGVQQARRVAP
jgi:ATP/maltotriose-dependent transcriptional regulator MalT/DNA-binding SARP family transcriptional activator